MARLGEIGANKASMRTKLRSALAHKSSADALLDGLVLTQERMNALLEKMDADDEADVDVDYEDTLVIESVFESDEAKLPAQNKASMRKVLRSALAHRKLADEICDAMEEIQVAYNALLVKLDAEAGALASTDFESELAVSVIDADAEGTGAQHKSSLRNSLRSALANAKLADDIIDAIAGAQEAFNASLVLLDAGTMAGVMADLEVEVLDIESRG